MKIRISMPGYRKLTCESVVTALAIVYLLKDVYLFQANVTLERLLNLVQYFFLTCISIVFIQQKFNRNSFILSFFILIAFAVSTLVSGVFSLFKYGLVILACINCDTQKVFSRLFKVYTWGVLLVFSLGLLGILPSITVRRGYSTFGFVHSNTSAVYILSALCCYFIVNYKQIKIKNYFFAFLTVAFTEIMTDSRTTLIVMVGLILFLFICKKKPVFFYPGHLLYYFVTALPFLLLFLSFLVGKNYDLSRPFYAWLDPLLNGRPFLADSLMSALDIKLWGQHINRTLVENAYIVCLYNFGIIPTIIEFWLYTFAIKQSMDKYKYGELICLVVFAFHGLMEVCSINPFMNIALLSTFSRYSNSPKSG